jgi:hypothetical protein
MAPKEPDRRKLLVCMVVFIALIVPALAKVPVDEDQYILKDEWKGKSVIVIKHGELTQVVFQNLYVVGDGQAYEWDGLHWSNTPVTYVINPSTAVKKYKLNADAVVREVAESFEAWDSAVKDADIFSAALVNSKAKASLGRPDGKNVVTWGALTDRNVIAVTTIWYYTATMQIVDTDIVFNTYYRWGIDTDGESAAFSLPANTFDIRNIGTHEAGHVCGLGDIYDDPYQFMTMYGYGSFGETQKISLETGDQAGINALY